MSKEFKNIDDLFQTELGGAETMAPSFVKPNIDKALGFSRRKRGFLLIGFVAILVTGLFAGIYMNDTTSNPEKFADSNDKTTNNETNENNISSSTSSTNTTEDQELSNQNPTVKAENSTLKTQSSSANDPSLDNSKSTLKTQSAGTKNPDSDNSKSTVKTQNTGTKNPDLDNSKSTVKTQNTDTKNPDSDNSKSTVKTQNIGTKNHDQDNSKSTVKTQNTGTTNPDLAVAVPTENSINQEITPNQETSTSENQVNESPENLAEEKTETDSTEAVTEKEKLEKDDLVEIDTIKRDTYKPWMISISGGPNFVRTAYTATTQDEKVNYDNSTYDLVGNQFNADITYRFKKGLSIGSGFGLTNYRELYAYNTEKNVLDTIYHTELVYEDTATTPSDTAHYLSFKERLTYVQDQGYNKAQYVNLPIHVGAQMIWGKFQLDITGSVRFNFLRGSSGGYVKDQIFVSFDKANTIYKKAYIDLTLGTRLHYNLWKSFHINASVLYRPVFGKIYTTETFNKSFDYVHLGVGLSYRF